MSVSFTLRKLCPWLRGPLSPLSLTQVGPQTQSKRFAKEKNLCREPDPEFPVVEPVINFMYCWYDIYDIWYDIWYMIYDMIWYMIYDMIWYDMIWYDMIWYDMIWYDMIWYDMIWYDMIWYDMIYDMIRYDMIRYDKIRYDMIYDMIRYMIWSDDTIRCDMIWYINCSWVDTRWQYTFTHKQYTTTQITTEQHK